MWLTKYLFLCAVVFLLAGCQKDAVIPVIEPEIPTITSFSIGDIQFRIEGEEITGSTDQLISTSSLFPVFTANGKVFVENLEQISGITGQDFSLPKIYKVTDAKGGSRDYKVKLTTFTGLPRIYITTEDGLDVTSKDDYKKGTFRMEPNGNESAVVPVTKISIKGRGNSTWDFVKKPYKIKFESAFPLFGAPASKEWVLLANYADKTLIRNYLALTLSAQMQMAFTPMARFVELYLNGRHDGNYLVSDQVEVSPSRVNVETLSDDEKDPVKNTGGYLLEIDRRIYVTKDNPFFESTIYPIVVKYPKDVSQLQMTYIKNYVIEAENVLLGSQFADPEIGFRKYFDSESIIKWYIICEIFKNIDSRDYSSIYMYKPRNGKIFFGPVWDFDLGAGNGMENPDCENPEEFFIRYHKWIVHMYSDPVFLTSIKETWKKYRTPIFNQIKLIDEAAAMVDKSQKVNFRLWPDFSDPTWTVKPGLKDNASHLAWLKDFLTKRINWLDTQFK